MPTAATDGGYSEAEAWRWLRAWPRIARDSRGAGEPGRPPPRSRLSWPAEHHICVRADLERALREVPDDLRACTLLRWRDDLAGYQIARVFHDRLSADECDRRAKAGAEVMVAWLIA